MIGEAVDVVIHTTRTDKGRIVREILEVFGFDRAKQTYTMAAV